MKHLQIILLGSLLLGACVAEDEPEEATEQTEQAATGWYRVRWTVAGLYQGGCGSVAKNFHAGHHVYVHYTFARPPECGSNETWAHVSDNYGNVGDMRFNALW